MKLTGRDKFYSYRRTIDFLVFVNSLFPKSINNFLLKFFRNTNGSFGLLIRYIIVKNISKSCGDNVSIHPNVFLFNLQQIDFGNNVSIHPMCYIEGAGEIEIGNNVSIAHGTSILSTNHSWENITIPIKYNTQILAKVCIKEDVWIGCGCRILAGVTVQKRSVIAAGAVVNKTVENNSIYGGVPAKLLKSIS